jgi:hypothetical protein
MRCGSAADGLRMGKRLTLVVFAAGAFAAADLIAKSALPTQPWLVHTRSPVWAAFSLGVFAGALLLTRLPSRAVAVASGVLAGGVVGNLVSAALAHGRIPNPFVFVGHEGVLAFNLADVFVLTGIVLQTAALVRVTIRHRHLLPQSSVTVRAARRLRRRFS